MATNRPTEQTSAASRLRQIEQYLPPRPETSDPAQPRPTARIVPAPRRVPVFLLGAATGPGFAELTITHPVPAPRRVPQPR